MRVLDARTERRLGFRPPVARAVRCGEVDAAAVALGQDKRAEHVAIALGSAANHQQEVTGPATVAFGLGVMGASRRWRTHVQAGDRSIPRMG